MASYKKLPNGVWYTLFAPAHFTDELLQRHLRDRFGVEIHSDRIELRNVGNKARYVVSFSLENIATALTKLGNDPAEPIVFKQLPPKQKMTPMERDTTPYVDLVWPPKDVEVR